MEEKIYNNIKMDKENGYHLPFLLIFYDFYSVRKTTQNPK